MSARRKSAVSPAATRSQTASQALARFAGWDAEAAAGKALPPDWSDLRAPERLAARPGEPRAARIPGPDGRAALDAPVAQGTATR